MTWHQRCVSMVVEARQGAEVVWLWCKGGAHKHPARAPAWGAGWTSSNALPGMATAALFWLSTNALWQVEQLIRPVVCLPMASVVQRNG